MVQIWSNIRPHVKGSGAKVCCKSKVLENDRKRSFILWELRESNPPCRQTQIGKKSWRVVQALSAQKRLNKVMMHGSVSSCYCLKWANNMSVTLQAVQTESRLHIDDSAFHVTLHVLLYKLVTFLWVFTRNSCPQIKGQYFITFFLGHVQLRYKTH